MECYKFFVLLLICISTTCADDLSMYTMFTWKNNSFYGFQGIRYAHPPVNNLRFMAPIPFAASWNFSNVTNITNLNPPPCPSPYTTVQNEDCLFLNVYTRSIMLNALNPVLVFIHPGGFYIGSGTVDDFGPEYLLEQDIVLVTFNYRLGFLGFAKGEPIPGNAGLKDQVLVLRWIQENIHRFGGNRNCVTLMGASAGAMSVALHLVSPLSEGLFHRAIIMSGGILPQLPTYQQQQYQLDLIQRHVRLMNCSLQNYIECLQNTNATTFSQNLYSMFEFGRDNPIFLWHPVIENNSDHFLSVDPLRQILKGQFRKVPILTGVTKNEIASSAFDLRSNELLFNDWVANFSTWSPVCLMYERNSEKSLNISSTLWNNYFGNGNYSFNRLNAYFSDGVINFPVYRLASIISQYSPAVYFYKFSYKGQFTYFNGAATITNVEASIVEHCDDLQYLFTATKRHLIKPNDADASMVDWYTQLITHFARIGTPPEIDLKKWPDFGDQENFININSRGDAILQKLPFDNALLWNSLFPTLGD